MLSPDPVLATLGRPKIVHKNATIFLAGTPIDGFYFIEHGAVRAYQSGHDGQEIEIGRFGAGEYFGEIVIFASANFPISTQATQLTRLRYFPKSMVLQSIALNPAVGAFFLNLLANKCLELNRRINTLTMQTVRQRLINYLLSLSPNKSHDRKQVVNLPISKTILAKQLGTISATLSRNFRDLQNEKLIIVKRQEIVILARTALKKEISFLPQ